jgi:2-hydroxychromene-2-carboxylate isomerase
VLSSAGFDARKLLKEAAMQQPKDILRANTQEAKENGLCGVPTYRVSHHTSQGWKTNGGIVWGQDESNVVMDLIAGWNEESSQIVAQVGPEHEAQGRSML